MATSPADPLRQVQLAVLAKAPIPGLAKTRLIPALGAEGAARAQRELTHQTLRTAQAAHIGPVTLWCTPDARHRFFRALQRATGVHCLVQASGDLGARMHTAFRLHCAQGPLLLVGTDCPAMQPLHLRRAAMALLEGADAVVQPAEDGGYVLIGLRQPQPTLFQDMPWSTDRVLAETRLRARQARLDVYELDTLWDVDRPEDLLRWRSALAHDRMSRR